MSKEFGFQNLEHLHENICDDDGSVNLVIKNPLRSEEEYNRMWQKAPIAANLLLFFTENMDEENHVQFSSYDRLKELVSMRFAMPGTYAYKQHIN